MSRDRWAEWLAVRRFGGDAETRERSLARLAATRDKVLPRVEQGLGEWRMASAYLVATKPRNP